MSRLGKESRNRLATCPPKFEGNTDLIDLRNGDRSETRSTIVTSNIKTPDFSLARLEIRREVEPTFVNR